MKELKELKDLTEGFIKKADKFIKDQKKNK